MSGHGIPVASVRRRLKSNEDGQALVEFVLVLPILLTLVFAAVELGVAYLHYQQLSAATSEGARAGIVAAAEADPEGIVVAAVEDAAPQLDSGELEVGVTSSWVSGEDLTVEASYPETISIFGLDVWEGDLENSRTMRVE